MPPPPVMKARNIQMMRLTQLFFFGFRFFPRPKIQPKNPADDLVRAIRGSWASTAKASELLQKAREYAGRGQRPGRQVYLVMRGKLPRLRLAPGPHCLHHISNV